uniref:PA14 domain/LCCL domain containing protein, putative n=1 Tax=Theileria annulata TaxID=5874 RepID=A0A3B0N633_THEAN
MCKFTYYILYIGLYCTHLVFCNSFFLKNNPNPFDNINKNIPNSQIQQIVPENTTANNNNPNYTYSLNTSNNNNDNLPRNQYNNNFNTNEIANNTTQNSVTDNSYVNNDKDNNNTSDVSTDENELNNQEENDNDLMYYLTQYRNRARRTVDGHLCAAAFVQRDQIYTDCTVEVAPDGTEGKEWCYLESQLIGKLEKDWGFCETPLNYEEIRNATLNHIAQKVSQVDEMLRSLNTYRKLIKESERRLSKVCGMGHKLISDSLLKIETMFEDSEKKIEEVTKIKNEIDKIKNEIKKIQCVHNEVRKSHSTQYYPDKYFNTILKLCSDIYNVSDGLIGTYYSNNTFEFPAVSTRIDPQINFLFVNKMPIIGLSPYKFSIRWEGYLKVPHSGNYLFELGMLSYLYLSLDTDSYGRVELNGSEIINLGIRVDGDDEIGYKYFIEPVIQRNDLKTSQSQQLIGGKFYQIKVEMSHSQQYKYSDGSESYFNLPASSFEIVTSLNGESAFRNNNRFFIANLTNGLIKAQLIRCDEKHNIGSFNMSVNQDSNLYVAYKKGFPFPLNPKEELQWIQEESMENLDVYDSGENSPSTGDIMGTLNRIFKFNHESTLVEVEVKQIALVRGVIYKFVTTSPDVSFIMFLSDNINSKQNQCIGAETLLSLPGGNFFMSCSESSSHSGDYDCNASLSGKYLDQRKSVWRTSGGTGENITVVFREPVLVTEFKFRPRDSSYTWPSKITLSFHEGGGETFSVFHSNDLEHHSYRLSVPKITTSVKLTIDEMYVSGSETGGSFGIIGIPCKFSETMRFVEILRCSETLKDLENIYIFKNDDKFLAECQPECLVNDSKFEKNFNSEKGEKMFSENDPICPSAVSNKYCSEDSGSCVVQVNVIKSSDSSGYLISKSHHKQKKRMKKIQILFRKQPDKTPTQGYLIDNGQVKSDLEDLSYGWFREAHGEFCHSNDNPLYGGGIRFPPPKESLDCLQKEKCSGNYWSIELPEDGEYKLEVILGSVCKSNNDSESYLEVNGTPLLTGEGFKSDTFYTIVKNVKVKNKRIKLTSTCKTDNCPETGTVLQMVSVEQL